MIRLMSSSLALALVLAAPLSAQEDTDNPIVAIVDGTEFRLNDLQENYDELPEQFRQMPLEAIYEPLLDRVIDGHLLLGAAEAADLEADPEVQTLLKRTRDDVLRQTMIERAAVAATDDAALASAYEERRTDPSFPIESVTARHILLETEEEAVMIIEQLDDGADFATLAIEHSTDPAAAQGGELGTFQRGAMVPPFEQAAFALEPGTYSTEPVETQFGFHVILVEAKEVTEPTFEEVEQELRAELAREAIESLLADVRSGAEIERFGIDGSPLE